MSITKEKKARFVLPYQNFDEIKKIVEANQHLNLNEIADILNKWGYKSKRGYVWTNCLVSNFFVEELGIRRHKAFTKKSKQLVTQEIKETEILPNYEIKDLVFEKEGKFFTDSLMIASIFEKEHKNVLRSIENLNCSEKFNKLNFEPIFFRDSMNREKTKYLITKDGFVFLAMGFTGDKAAEFKEIYINKFNEMEQTIKQSFQPIQRELSTMELMAITLKGFNETRDNYLTEIRQESDSIKFETHQALETQKQELDLRIKELDKKLSDIPVIKERHIYTQAPFDFYSEGLKDTGTTFKHKDSTLLEQREKLRAEITKDIKKLANSGKIEGEGIKDKNKKAWFKAYNLFSKQIEDNFYHEFIQINDNRNPNDQLTRVDYILNKDMGKTLLLCIKKLINN